MTAEPDATPELRLHPWSWLFAAASFVRQMIIPIIAVLVFGARNDGALWGALLLVPILTVALWQQWVFRYGFSARGLVVHEGLVFRTIRHIDYDRIENIDIERNVLHRVFGVAQLRVETSTGGRAEAVFRVLGMDAVQALRERVFTESQRFREELPLEPSTPPPALLALPPGELVRYGLIDNRGLIVVAAVFGMLHQTGLLRVLETHVERFLDRLAIDAVISMGPAAQVLLAVATLTALVAAVRALSIGFALLSFHGFTLSAANGDFRVRYGLLTRVTMTLRIARIQAVHQAESLLHRWFGRVSVRVDLLGGLEAGGEATAERTHWLAPICRPEQSARLMHLALPDVSFESEAAWQQLATGARRRIFKRSAVVWTLVLLLPGVWLAGRWALTLPIATVPWAAMYAWLYVRHTRWALTEDAVLFREGWFNRRMMIVPRTRVQSAIRLQSPFDRRWRMATASVDTAGVRRGQFLRIRYLPEGIAQQLVDSLYRSSHRAADEPAAFSAGTENSAPASR
jgi:putative membrane protein